MYGTQPKQESFKRKSPISVIPGAAKRSNKVTSADDTNRYCPDFTEGPPGVSDEKVQKDLLAPLPAPVPVPVPASAPVKTTAPCATAIPKCESQRIVNKEDDDENDHRAIPKCVSTSLVNTQHDDALARKEHTVIQAILESLKEIPNLEQHQYLKLVQGLFKENVIQELIGYNDFKKINFGQILWDDSMLKERIKNLIIAYNKSNH
tara:strand:+ start:874 stop:1491 length:618 start_codon:yes stop_codon:yes gene_type:complete